MLEENVVKSIKEGLIGGVSVKDDRIADDLWSSSVTTTVVGCTVALGPGIITEPGGISTNKTQTT